MCMQVDDGAQNIRAKVEQGFMVRTAVDKNLVEQFNKQVHSTFHNLQICDY